MRYALLIAALVYLLTFGNFLFSPGTLIYLDSVPPLYPERYFAVVFSGANTWGAASLASLPFQVLAVVGSKLLSPFLFRELFLLACFLVGGAFLFKSLEVRRSARYLGVLLLLYNPFVYLRITAAGQLGMVAATVLAPVFLYYLFTYYRVPTRAQALKLALAYTFVSMFQAHFFILNAVIFLLYSGILALKREAGIREIGVASIAILLVNLYWLAFVPLLKPVAIAGVTEQHMRFFYPKPSLDLNSASKLAGLYGFWREGAVERIYEEVPFYVFIAFVSMLIYLSIHGFLSAPRDSRNILFISLIFLGVILALSVQYLDLKPFRDSHKFAYFTLLGYTYLIPRGVEAHRRFKLILLVVAAVLLYFNHMQILLAGQLHPIDYPEDYKEAGRVLDHMEGEVVYLPWKQYITYNWSLNAGLDGRIGNPMNAVTRKMVKTGCDPAFDYCFETQEQRKINVCLGNRSTACLKNLNVSYVIIDSCALVPESYDWVEGKEVFSRECIRILKLS